MSNYDHIKRMTKCVGGKIYTFRSKLEYRWAQWCEMRKLSREINNWFYEDKETLLILETAYFHNTKLYLPDFTIQYINKNPEKIGVYRYEFEETKGYFPPKDYTKIKLAAQQYENPITLIFANLSDHSKSTKIRAQYNRAKRLEPHLKRIIYHAQRDIFRKAGIN